MASLVADAWRTNSTAPAGDGVYGRLVYLRSNSDEATAHLVTETRRVAFVADGASWVASIGLSAKEILLRNGVEAAWIETELSQGTQFILVFFDDDGTVWPADWDGVRRAITTYHEEIASKLLRHWDTLLQLKWC